jgi:hypothetical protein
MLAVLGFKLFLKMFLFILLTLLLFAEPYSCHCDNVALVDARIEIRGKRL